MALHDHLLKDVAKARSKDTKKKDSAKAEQVLSRLFDQQRAFVTDKARRKAALCPRRAGKSYAVLYYLVWVCLTRSQANTLCIGVTRGNVKGTYWKLLKQLDKELELDCHFQNTELVCTFKNGSQILFSGADTTHEIDKFRGQGYDLVCIDECKSYASSLLDELIDEVIMPALSDRLGTLVLIGTPGAILAGPFWEITTCQRHRNVRPYREFLANSEKWKGRGYLWSLHTWSSKDNVNCPWIWEDALSIKEAADWGDDHPVWLREFRGEWVPDNEALVYAYPSITDGRCDWLPDKVPESERNEFGLPAKHQWRYLLGLDLGWADEAAFVVAAWSDTEPSIHYIHVEKHSFMTVQDIVNKTNALERKYGRFYARIADTGGLGKTIIESLAQDFGIRFEAARKQDKQDFIKLMNSDQHAGRIKVHPQSPLADEWRLLQWSFKDGERKTEDKGCANHAADAALYLWRHAYHHFARSIEEKALPGSQQWWNERERAEEQKYREELLAKKKAGQQSRFRELLASRATGARKWT